MSPPVREALVAEFEVADLVVNFMSRLVHGKSNARLTAVWLLVVVTLTCCVYGGADDTPVPPVTDTPDAVTTIIAKPSPIVSQTAVPTPALQPTVEETSSPGLEALPVSAITIPSRRLGETGASANLGTAPAPTPTPVPKPNHRSPAAVAFEVSTYGDRAVPTERHVTHGNQWFDDVWQLAQTAEEQAAQLQLLGTRLSQVCTAISALKEVPPEATGTNTLLREAVRVRHRWVELAVEQLRCCGVV